jgi:enoyl-CoA hydratase/carnithine racemase
MSRYERYKNLIVTVESGVATVTLHRPEALNAVNVELHGDLEYVWGDLNADKDVCAVIVTGAGKAFSAGGDVKLMASRAGTEAGLKHALNISAATRRVFNGILELQHPLIAAINGDATGLGATIALFSDVTVMAEDARIGDTHVNAGLVAGDGGAVIWPLLIGLNKAKELLMTGRLVKGAEAAEIGLVNHTCPADEVMPRAREIAERMASQPVWALRWTKLALNKTLKQAYNLTLDAGLGFEVATLFTHDHKEAVSAFAEKRKPTYTGG